MACYDRNLSWNVVRSILCGSRNHRTCRWLLRNANSTSKMPKHCKTLAFLTLLCFWHHAGELVPTEALSKTHRQIQQVHFWIGIDPNYSFWDRGAKRMVRFFAQSIFLAPGPQIFWLFSWPVFLYGRITLELKALRVNNLEHNWSSIALPLLKCCSSST